MRAAIAEEEAEMRRRYVASKRHTIQVDFHDYLRLLRRERRRTEGDPVLARRRGGIVGRVRELVGGGAS
jgi:hypothetical protein